MPDNKRNLNPLETNQNKTVLQVLRGVDLGIHRKCFEVATKEDIVAIVQQYQPKYVVVLVIYDCAIIVHGDDEGYSQMLDFVQKTSRVIAEIFKDARSEMTLDKLKKSQPEITKHIYPPSVMPIAYAFSDLKEGVLYNARIVDAKDLI